MSVVIVGVDGSPSSSSAVTLAAAEAERRGARLRIVHAFIWPLMPVPLGPSPEGPPEGGLRHAAEHLLADAEREARLAAPGVPVEARLVTGGAAAVLLAEGREADLIVVGDRGLGGFAGLLLGSVASALVAHSTVPVLVARGSEDPDGPVVVGVDGVPESAGAIDAAFREASDRRAELLAMHAWRHPASLGPGDFVPVVFDYALMADEEARVLAEALAGYQAEYPDVKVERRTVQGQPARLLIDLSNAAQLVVVGSRGRGGFSRLLLGATSQQVLHHAHCPVLLVPSGERD